MLVVTTPTVEGAPVQAVHRHGLRRGDLRRQHVKDFGANLSNMFGGRASQYEEETWQRLCDRRQRNVRTRAGHGCETRWSA